MAKYLPDFRQGDTFRVRLDYPAGTDLTGYEHWLTIRRGFGVDPPVLVVSSVFGDHTGDEGTVAYIEATPAETALVPSGKYVYDVQASAPNGDIVTLVPPVADYKDVLFVAPQVTTEQ